MQIQHTQRRPDLSGWEFETSRFSGITSRQPVQVPQSRKKSPDTALASEESQWLDLLRFAASGRSIIYDRGSKLESRD